MYFAHPIDFFALPILKNIPIYQVWFLFGMRPTSIGGPAVVAFWRSPHGPLGSGPPRAGYSQRRKRKEKGKGPL